MSLTTKIAAILTALILALTTVGALVQNRVIGRIFADIEKEEAGEELARVRAAIDDEVAACARRAESYGVWQETRDLIDAAPDERDAFITSNLDPAVLEKRGIDLLYICTLDGTVKAGVILDPLTGDRTDLRQFPNERLSSDHPLLTWSLTDSDRQIASPHGIMITERDPLLVAVEPIVTAGGRRHGWVIVGSFLAGDLAERIADRTQVDFQAWAIGEGTDHLPGDAAAVLDEVTGSATPVLREVDGGERLAVYATYDGIRRRPDLLLRAGLGREISRAGSAALASGALTDATLGLAILLGLLFTLNAVVLRPIKALTEHAVRTGQSENFRAKFGLERDDEIGTLGTAFDEMMAKLEHARSALVETARTAGMSEIATGILHNVGNVLNSVNISASLVSQRVEGLCIDDLERLSEVLTENKDDLTTFLQDDPRGQHIQPFLSAVVEQLSEEQKSIRGEVHSLTDGIDHICELIKSQQSFAKGTKLIEPTDLSERLDEALRITQRVHGVDDDLVVVRRFEDLPDVSLDKHKLLEILVNLVQNARQAMASVDGPRELVLEVARMDDDRVRLAVADTGVGIAHDDLTRVFTMGFTTREEGHGFGLHSSANAAVEMGGQLYAESDGPGRGARFVLDLPIGNAATTAGDDDEPVALGGAA